MPDSAQKRAIKIVTANYGVAKRPLPRPIHAMTFRILLLLSGLVATLSTAAQSEEATVAVATNFLSTARDISAAFMNETGHEVILVHGSTGKLYAQIVAGAPYDVFLSADADRPARLASGGFLVEGSPKPYAVGRLALVYNDASMTGSIQDILSRQDLRVAVADPAVAPYGRAARSVIETVRGSDWRNGIVLGESVAQAFAFVATGNADIGLVALSLAIEHADRIAFHEVPATFHETIRQDAALMIRREVSGAAHAFYEFLDLPTAVEIMTEAGYGVPP